MRRTHPRTIRSLTGLTMLVATWSLLAGSAGVAHAGDFLDTRLTFTLGDDQFLPGERNLRGSLSPNVSFDERGGYRLFFDNLNTRDSGRENELHAVVYKKAEGFFPGVITEAAGVIEIDLFRKGSVLDDDGSYIKLEHRFQGVEIPERAWDVTLFPLSTDRVRLGYSFFISWGGDDIFPRLSGSAPVPGARFGFKYDRIQAFVAFKTAILLEAAAPNPEDEFSESLGRTNYAAMGGVSADFTDYLHLDVSGGYFQQGVIETLGFAGLEQYTFGGSAQLVLHLGTGIGSSIDFRLFRNDPEFRESLHKATKYDDKTSLRIALEGSYLLQHLGDVNNFGGTVLQPAFATALTGRLRISRFRIFLDAFVRSPSFMVLNRPGFAPGTAFLLGDGVKSSPDLFVSAGVDYYFEKPHLTLGIFGGVQMPATISVDGAGPTGETATIVLRSETDQESLPIGFVRVPIFTGKIVAKWDISKILTLLAAGFVGMDRNLTNRASFGDLDFIQPLVLGAYASAAARF